MERFLDFQMFEGVQKQGEVYKLDFSGDSEGDIMSLMFSNKKRKKMYSGATEYEYYYAFEFDGEDGQFLESLKSLDDKISQQEAKLLVNKAVMGFDHAMNASSYDTIIYPQSSSVILKKLATQLHNKAGNTFTIPDAFVKASRGEIKFDQEKIDKLPPRTKKEVERIISKIRSEEGTFKIHTVWSRYRKFIQEFLVFNKEQDRKVFNAITGKRVILVDDYRTSGTTLKDMIKSLIALRPEKIAVFILINVK